MHYCDHGHETHEARYLPLGQNSGIWVCKYHHEKELDARIKSGAWEKVPQNFPAWQCLGVQGESSNE